MGLRGEGGLWPEADGRHIGVDEGDLSYIILEAN